MNQQLAAVAGRQGGAFTVAQAVAAGYSRAAVRHRVAAGQWYAPRHGVLASWPPPEDDLARLVRDAWVAVLAHSDAVVGFGRAADLHGLATYRPVPGLELVRPKQPGRTPVKDSVRVTTAVLPPAQVGQAHGVPVTSLERTACDIARRGSLRDGVVALDSALRLGADPGSVEDVVRTARGWPGVRSLRQGWAVADPGSESPLESLAHVLHHEAGIPRARTQVDLYDARGFIGRVDDYWPEFATVGESDGLAKYEQPGALRAEKLRQERLEQAGLQVVRVIYSDVTRDGAATARRYRQAFDRGRQRLAWGPVTAFAPASPEIRLLDAG